MRIDRRGFIELTAAGAASAALPGVAFAQRAAPITSSIFVTADSVDPVLSEPIIEVNEMRSGPEPHRYVRGGFKGSTAKFSFYFPPKERYQGRFFHNTYPLIVDSDVGPSPIGFKINEGNIGFCFDSGAYLVQTNQGPNFVQRESDPGLSSGYRLNAAAAKFSRVVAAEVYGRIPRPYGYIHGGSGGAYQTMGCAENTGGVWDGFLPYVLGSPLTFFCRPYAMYVLGKRKRFPEIVDALDPGGSGDPYATLNADERAALREVTSIGFPLRGWWQYDSFAAPGGGGGDAAYVADFWSKPGYAGADPNSPFRRWRIQAETTISAATAGPPATLTLTDVPSGDLTGAQLVVLSGPAAGRTLPLGRLNGKTMTLGGGGGGGGLGAALGGGRAAAAPAAPPPNPQPGDRVRIDNSGFLAGLLSHRYNIPTSREYLGYEQFRGPDGKPLYPQRGGNPVPSVPVNAYGSVATGRITGKVLAMNSMMDINATAWNADWYRSTVRKALGPRFADNFALRFTDNAMHDFPGFFGSQGLEKRAWSRTVAYDGALQQGLRDLADWVEKGIRPAETQYKMVEGAVVQLPARARDRGGIQPVATLLANGKVRAEVKTNTPVKFAGTIEVPPNAGKVVAVEWDYEGTGNRFKEEPLSTPQAIARVSGQHSYAKPGTYFAVLRAFSQRQGDTKTPYARVQNVARARVVVS